MRIIKFFLSSYVFLLLSVQGLSAQEFLFPELKGYKSVSDYQVYTPDDLWNYIDGAADVYLTLGFIDLHINEYVKGKQSLKAEVYRFGDDSKAFGIYSLERSPGYNFINAGVQGYKEEGVLNFFKGIYYVKIMTHSKSKRVNDSMSALAGIIAERIKGSEDFPSVLKAFPSEGLLKNQETYLYEGVLGHDYLQSAFRASYEIEGDRFDIYLINNISADRTNEMTSKLTGAASLAGGDDTEKYVIEDGFNGVLYMARKGNRLFIISGLDKDKRDLAEKYLNLIISH